MPGLTPIAGAPSAGAVERFRSDVTALLGVPLNTESRLALAVSGGADSMAMLALAFAAFPGRVLAATVDHGLRRDSAAEAAMVAAHCAGLGVPHRILLPSKPIAGASVQARAREARYEALLGWAAAACAEALLTAHHADDQAETFLMRAARGSGLPGLAGIRARRELWLGGHSLPAIRPLLAWRRAELRAIAEATGTPFAEDPSNRDPAYDRARFRKMIESNPELDVAGIASTATYAAEAEQTLADLAQAEWDKRAMIEGARISLDVSGLAREFTRRLVRRAIGEVRRIAFLAQPAWSEGANIEPLLDALERGKGATRAAVRASVKGRHWRFEPAPPRRSH